MDEVFSPLYRPERISPLAIDVIGGESLIDRRSRPRLDLGAGCTRDCGGEKDSLLGYAAKGCADIVNAISRALRAARNRRQMRLCSVKVDSSPRNQHFPI